MGNIRAAVTLCHQQYTELQTWVSAENKYNKYLLEVAQARHRRPPASIANLGPPPPKPGPQPPAAGATCPPSEAFGIPASALVPAGSGHS